MIPLVSSHSQLRLLPASDLLTLPTLLSALSALSALQRRELPRMCQYRSKPHLIRLDQLDYFVDLAQGESLDNCTDVMQRSELEHTEVPGFKRKRRLTAQRNG